MKFTTIAADAFKKLQLNAGVLLTEFDPSNPAIDRSKILLATSGGNTFTAAPTFVDFGEDIDNVPANTKELKVLDSVEATMSGTGKTVDTDVAKRLIGAADVDENGKITPRADLLQEDFDDLWWVGDYSDVNTGDEAGFIAIRLINALSTGGFSLSPNDKGKGDFAYTFTGHYSIDDISILPYEIYIAEGSSEPPAPTYTYTPVTPVGTEDPSEEGWYERSGTEGSYVYTLTADTSVNSEKTYYERS